MIPSIHEVIINCIFCLLEDLPSILRKRVYINHFLILSIILASKKVHVYLVIVSGHSFFVIVVVGGGVFTNGDLPSKDLTDSPGTRSAV